MADNKPKSQLEIGEIRQREPDRNFHRGGRSFYFFDFDDNIAFLTTPLILFHKSTGAELPLSSAEWALHHATIGQSGIYSEYEIRWDDQTGTFKNFRDLDISELERLQGRKQPFVQDILGALGLPDLQWKISTSSPGRAGWSRSRIDAACRRASAIRSRACSSRSRISTRTAPSRIRMAARSGEMGVIAVMVGFRCRFALSQCNLQSSRQ